MRLGYAVVGTVAALFLAFPASAQTELGGTCAVDTDCITGCCQFPPSAESRCVAPRTAGPGDECRTFDGCDCQIGLCVNGVCTTAAPSPTPGFERACGGDLDCDSGCCGDALEPPICVSKGTVEPGDACFTDDGCDCRVAGLCIEGTCPVCPNGTNVCDDPHMQGLRGQTIDWSGVDGGWYCLVTDDNANLHVNVKLTAPLPVEFPDRQLITGISILSEGHSVAIEVKNPYDVQTDGCPGGTSPCLADGGLVATVDGTEVDGFLRSSKNEHIADGIAVSASNLPVECRQFGGDKIWARMHDEMLKGTRELTSAEIFEDWILRFDHMAAPDWCAQYISQHDLAEVQSNHAIFKIVTSAVTVRLNVGTNFQGDGELDWDGRVLPDLEFWQMDVGILGLSVESESLSGILGETSRPVMDEDGKEVMKGKEAFRGTVGDYRVSGPLGTEFTLLDKQ